MSQSLIQRCRAEALEQFHLNLKHVNARHSQADLAAKGTQQGIQLVEGLFNTLDANGTEQEVLQRALQAAQQLAEDHPADTYGHWCHTVLKRAVWVLKSKLPETQAAFQAQQQAYQAQINAHLEAQQAQWQQGHRTYLTQKPKTPRNIDPPKPPSPDPLKVKNQKRIAAQKAEWAKKKQQREAEERRIAQEKQHLLEQRQQEAIQQRLEREAKQQALAAQRRCEVFDPALKKGIVDLWQRSVSAPCRRDAHYYASKGWPEIHQGLDEGIEHACAVINEVDPHGEYVDILESGLELAKNRFQQVQGDNTCNQWCHSVLEGTVKFFEHHCKAHRRQWLKDWLQNQSRD